MSFPLISGRRFEDFNLNELLDFYKYVVRSFIVDCKTAKDVAEKVIVKVQYPLYMGQPDDEHHWNNFHGKWCNTISEDYWQTCSETALMLIGDCEDSSVLCVGAMRALGVVPENVYEVFGVVRDAKTGEILGGHGWLYAMDASFGTLNYVLVESTLDTPPARYPDVGMKLDDLKEPFTLNNVIYDPEVLFNDKYYIEVNPLSFRMDTVKKHEALERAWNCRTKLTSKLRTSKIYKIRRLIKLK